MILQAALAEWRQSLPKRDTVWHEAMQILAKDGDVNAILTAAAENLSAWYDKNYEGPIDEVAIDEVIDFMEYEHHNSG